MDKKYNPNIPLVQSFIKNYVVNNVLPPQDNLYLVKTDINEFPYPRFFRGSASSTSPIFWEREAGYCPIVSPIKDTPIYDLGQNEYISPCFQLPCSTILPCKASNKKRYFEQNTNQCIYHSP